ncbi:MAG: RIP metalloprotease RseP [Candidatus Omnitrophica bacterium]|nr:RIP metalloprotease RseP [Candidatus Omnitrophota bacterium]MBL7210273.1 RIP metalloprotease RseP [Candidatus Omnitrophota bacterium]
MITLFIFLVILGILILVHEFGHFIAARRTGVRVERFSIGFGPRIFRRKKGNTEYCLSLIPLGGFVKLAGDNLEEYKGKGYEYFSKAPGKRFQIIFAGPFFNYLLGFLCFWTIFFSGYPTLTSKVGGLLDGFGAKAAGLRIGDKITAIDGRNVSSWEELQAIILDRRAFEVVRLSVLRKEQEFNLNVALKEKSFDDALGEKQKVGLLGITPDLTDTVYVRYGIVASFLMGINKTWVLTELTYKGLWRMVTGKIAVRDSAAGPLGIFFITSKVARQGITALLNFMGIISVSLALFNLLPLPVLDGGHILFLAIEKIRGKTLSVKAERIITQIGLAVIISLFLFVTYNDVMRAWGYKITGILK